MTPQNQNTTPLQIDHPPEPHTDTYAVGSDREQARRHALQLADLGYTVMHNSSEAVFDIQEGQSKATKTPDLRTGDVFDISNPRLLNVYKRLLGHPEIQIAASDATRATGVELVLSGEELTKELPAPQQSRLAA